MRKIAMALALLLITAHCRAQSGKWDTGVIEGYSFAAGNASKTYKASPLLGVFAGYIFGDNVSAGLEAARYFEFDSKISRGKKMTMLQFSPYIKIRKELPAGAHKIIPFAVLGAGAYKYKDDDILDASGNKIYSGDSGTKIGYNAGIGLEYEIVEHWRAGAEARWHYVHRTSAFDAVNTALRISYLF